MKKRLEREDIGIDVKTGRVEQCCARYGVGRNAMRQIASQAGAVIRIGKSYLIDIPKVDKYLDSIAGKE